MALPKLSDLSAWRPTAIALLAAALGGGLFALAGLPAAWLSGGIVAVAALALAGVPVATPALPLRLAFLILGVSMGAAVTPETLRLMTRWPISLALLALSVPAVAASVMTYLLRRPGFDRTTAFYAAAPGALTYVMALALTSKADMRLVAFVQTVRLFLLAVGLPAALMATGELAAPPAAAAPGRLDELAVMAVAGVVFGLAFERLRVPGGLIVGAMLSSAVLHGGGFVFAGVPQVALIACFVLLGANIGGRFAGTDAATLRRVGATAAVAFLIALLVASLFALAAALLADLPIGQTVVAYAPGGLEAMIILGFALGYDPAFVGAHHLLRFLGIALLLPLAARLVLGPGPPKS